MNKWLILPIGAIFFVSAVLGTEKPASVNVLTWWGYLNKPWIKSAVKKSCNVDISFDEYYSNAEFLRRWREKRISYDIIIFSDTILNPIKDEISRTDGSLYKISDQYNPYIKAQYLKKKYPSNVVYFLHSVTGFLGGQSRVSLSSEDTIASIFKKAGNSLVVLMDDPAEVNLLVNRGLGKNDSDRSLQDLKYLTQNTRVYITNDYDGIYKRPDFAFAYTWSGEAIKFLTKTKNKYQFLIHPKLSYISSDLIATLNGNDSSLCVSKFLASKQFLTKLNNDLFYFSPYGETEIKNPIYQELHSKVFSNLKTMTWISHINEKELKILNQMWTKIQLEFARNARNQSANAQKLH